MSVAVSFSTQRNAGMSSLEPSRMPACEAPVCDERSVSHSVSRCVPLSSQPAIVGALPSRIARRSTGSANPSISRKTIPGASLRMRSPERRAMRCMTRKVYVSSSSVPRSTSSPTPTAEATSATSSADQKESTERSPSVMLSAAISMSASRMSTSAKPTRSMNGRRSAAISGGNSAFRIAMTSAAIRALPKPSTWAPGTIHVANMSVAAAASQERTTRGGL